MLSTSTSQIKNQELSNWSEWVIVVYRKLCKFSAISMREQVNVQWDDDEVRFELDQHAYLDLYSASELKQQSTDRNVDSLGHILLIPSSSLLFLLNATNINFIVVGLTRSGLEPKTYRTQGEHINHYTTDVVTVKLVFVSYP
jgi:hypothetical protein